MASFYPPPGRYAGLLALALLAGSTAFQPMRLPLKEGMLRPQMTTRSYRANPLWRREEGILSEAAIRGQRRHFAALTPEQEAEKRQLQSEITGIDKLLEEKTALIKTIKADIEALQERKKSYQLEINKRLTSFELTQETPLRSLVKACSWRFVAALITLSTSLFFSRNAAVAASIVSSDFLSKAGTMYIGERAWNRVSWGKKNKGDTASRSVIKAVAWRLFAMVNTLIVSVVFAKNMKTASQIASADTVIKTTLYVVHERIWDKIEWGKQYDVEFNI